MWRTTRPTAWRKNSSVVVVVANTAILSRGRSTPSLTIRTATIHGSVPVPKSAIRSEASGSSEVATTAGTPRAASSSAIPAAWAWSMAITRPPAAGSVRRSVTSRSWACSSTVGSHSPSRLSAVRNRWLARSRPRSSSKVAATTSPSGATHSMNPLIRGK